MGTDNLIFLEVIEWLDSTGIEIGHRIPEGGSGEIKYGAQLIVRESQAAVFFYQGRAYDAFGAGRHTLSTANIPILTKILSIPWGMKSPLRAEVYFVNMREFPNLKWGTRDPVAFKDSKLGLIRLRAFGIFGIRVLQPVLLINRLIGTRASFDTDDLEDFIGKIIVSRLNDHLGEHLDTLFDLPGRYDEMAGGLLKRVSEDLAHFGLGLTNLYINSITPPPDVQQAIDDKSRLALFDDLNSLLKMKAAMAIERASAEHPEAGGAMGMGVGMMLPAMFGELARASSGTQHAEVIRCPECTNTIAKDAKFCQSCGSQLIVFLQCASCGQNLPPDAKFCSSCGRKVEETGKLKGKKCKSCGERNLANSVFCNQCGERLQ